MSFEHAGEIEQVRGIAGGEKTGAQGGVVTGKFAFGAEAGEGQPAERVEPVDGGGDVGGEEDRGIAPADVGGFVGEDGAAAGGRP